MIGEVSPLTHHGADIMRDISTTSDDESNKDVTQPHLGELSLPQLQACVTYGERQIFYDIEVKVNVNHSI